MRTPSRPSALRHPAVRHPAKGRTAVAGIAYCKATAPREPQRMEEYAVLPAEGRGLPVEEIKYVPVVQRLRQAVEQIPGACLTSP